MTVNGVAWPWPDAYSVSGAAGTQTTATLVNSGRNANGVLVGEQIGRTQSKLTLSWNVLDAQVWASMLQQFSATFTASVAYYDMEQGKVITRQMYVGDRTALPLGVNPDGSWIKAQQCKLDLIDTGA